MVLISVLEALMKFITNNFDKRVNAVKLHQ